MEVQPCRSARAAVRTPPLPHPARRLPQRAAATAAQNGRRPPELQAHVRQQLAGPEAVRERRALLLSSSDPSRSPAGATSAAQLPGARSTALGTNCTDTTVNASTTPNDTTRDDATHDTLPTPTTHTPNVRRKRRLGALSRNPSIYSKDLKPVTDVKPTLFGDLRL